MCRVRAAFGDLYNLQIVCRDRPFVDRLLRAAHRRARLYADIDYIKGTDFWTADAQKNALAAALETVKAQLSGDVQKYIQSNFGDLDEWITTQIEAAIYDLKNKPSEVANASA